MYEALCILNESVLEASGGDPILRLNQATQKLTTSAEDLVFLLSKKSMCFWEILIQKPVRKCNLSQAGKSPLQ